MKRAIFVVAFIAWASVAGAQTHPCDVTPADNPTVFNPYTVQFCWNGTDLDGLAMAPEWVQVRITIDGVAQPLLPLPAPVGDPSPTGDRLYQVDLVTSRGPHTLTVALVAPEGDGTSAPVAYSVKGKAPKPPTVFVVQ